jgi:hypothetical protein
MGSRYCVGMSMRNAREDGKIVLYVRDFTLCGFFLNITIAEIPVHE